MGFRTVLLLSIASALWPSEHGAAQQAKSEGFGGWVATYTVDLMNDSIKPGKVESVSLEPLLGAVLMITCGSLTASHGVGVRAPVDRNKPTSIRVRFDGEEPWPAQIWESLPAGNTTVFRIPDELAERFVLKAAHGQRLIIEIINGTNPDRYRFTLSGVTSALRWAKCPAQ